MPIFRLCEFTKQSIPSTFVFKIIFSLGIICSSHQASAFDAVIETFPIQYEVVTIQNPETEQLILGELTDAPEMYEIVSETPFTLTAEIRAIPDSVNGLAPQLSGIVIRQKEIRGVEEIARLNAADVPWTVVSDKSTGLKYQAGPYFSTPVDAGTYRIEVSSPNNQGKYMLLVGSQPDNNSYLASLSDIASVYAFYDINTVRMFSSPYVHYPIGILILLLLIAGTFAWQRNKKRHA
jgi:hypothetical protein